VRWLAPLALLALACAAPVRVSRVDARAVHHELASNVLTHGTPSRPTLQVLERLALAERFESEPERALAELHEGIAPSGDRGRIFALAELSFLHGEASRKREYYLAAAVYAWAFLFPGEGETPPDRTDPRLRLACDLYNLGLTKALQAEGEVRLEAGRHALPFGALEVEVDPSGFTWAGYRLEDFVPAADFAVHGLRNRYRRPGIGAPLAASIVQDETLSNHSPVARRIPETLKVPVTAVLLLERPRRGLSLGELRGVLGLHSQDHALAVSVDGVRVPLEFETTSSLAYTLHESRLWDTEIAGFRSGDFVPFLGDRVPDGLLLLHPHRPGAIPVVLVHGTASSPARWADLVNELEADPRLWSRYQIWLFIYNTGNPVGYSAGLLRSALENAVRELDPAGTDPALRQMVVIGHSQGGLLAKLTAVDSGTRFWDDFVRVPIDELRVSDSTRETLRRSSFFTPLPFVKRVVFICTPHGGSYLAGMSFARLVSDLVRLPTNLMKLSLELATIDRSALVVRQLGRLPTSIDNMTPGNPFIQTLGSLPVAEGIASNSIIAVKGDGPLEHASDGVVAYTSAHVSGVQSEKIVRSGHSAQGAPATIEEVRRILLEHAGL
jgi:pimeloyl-ACP methyl ester carboxylesterase